MSETGKEHEDLEPDRDGSLAELKELLADEGLEADDSGAEDLLAGLTDDEDPDPEPGGPAATPRRRGSRREARGRRAEDEQVFRDLESQLAAEPLDVKISDDRLTALIGRVGADDDLDSVLQALRRSRVTRGIDEAAIEAAIKRAENGSAQYDVVGARGEPSVVLRQASLRYHLPAALRQPVPSPLAALKQALEGPALEVVEAWSGVTHVVNRGDLLADIAPAQFDPGEDVFGEPIEPELEEPPEVPCGEHAVLSADGSECRAAIYGFAGLLDGQPAVVPPVWTAPDSMEARFVCLDQPPTPVPSEEEFAEMLQVAWIEFGVDNGQVQEVIRCLTQGEDLTTTTVIARGELASEGKDGSLRYCRPPANLPAWRDVGALMKARDRDTLEAGLADLRATGAQPLTVHAGDVVVSNVAAEPGITGHDVHGEDLEAAAVEEPEWSLGEHVEIAEEGLRAVAGCWGCVCVHGAEQISVVPSLWLAADLMSLCLVYLHSGGDTPCLPTVEELAQLAERDKRLEGVDLSTYPAQRQQLQAGDVDTVIPLLAGTPPQAGQDARFEWLVEVGGRAGRILEDGSIDLRDRNVISVVEEGQLLGKLHAMVPGVPGTDVLGNDVAPPPVAELEVTTDANVTMRDGDEGVTEFVAVGSGGVYSTEETRRAKGGVRHRMRLGLFAVSEIESDVDYTTGHVRFEGDVVIKGSVKPLFEVHASGTVTIGGNVEPGARIQAGGDIAVGGGVIGEATRLEAGGGVMAKFVQQASIRAGGDVEVGAYMFEASVRTRGQVKVAGQGEGSGRALVGGLMWAGTGIETPSLGSPSNPRIRLVVGIDPVLVSDADEVRRKVRTCERRQLEALERFGLNHLDAEAVKRRLARAKGTDRDALMQQAKALAEFGDLQQRLEQRLEEMAETQRKHATHAQVTVDGAIFAGPELRIGEHLMTIEQDAEKLRYQLLTDEEGGTRIEAASL